MLLLSKYFTILIITFQIEIVCAHIIIDIFHVQWTILNHDLRLKVVFLFHSFLVLIVTIFYLRNQLVAIAIPFFLQKNGIFQI